MRRLFRWSVRLALLLVAGWGATLAAVWWWSMRDTRGPADVIVVLGAAQYAGRPSPVLRARLDHALGLWEAGLAPRLLFTGGRGVRDTLSEAQVGRRYAIRRGVAPEAIWLETDGRTTSASMRAAAAMLRPKGLVRVLLVSDPFHMLRLELLARANGLTPLLSPTPTSPIGANRERRREYMLRESLAIPAELVRVLGG